MFCDDSGNKHIFLGEAKIKTTSPIVPWVCGLCSHYRTPGNAENDEQLPAYEQMHYFGCQQSC
jgi:hypothetical protein